MKTTYHLPVPQPSTKTLEVFTTELAHDVLWRSLGPSIAPAFDPWSHGFDFVLDIGIPGLRLNIHVASLAVEVFRIVAFVVSHQLVGGEGLVAAGDCAPHRPDRIEGYVHVGGEFAGSCRGGLMLECVWCGVSYVEVSVDCW